MSGGDCTIPPKGISAGPEGPSRSTFSRLNHLTGCDTGRLPRQQIITRNLNIHLNRIMRNPSTRLIPIALIAATLLLSSEQRAVAQQGKLENPTKLYMGLVTAPDGTPVTSGRVLIFEDPYPNVVTSSKINEGLGYRVQLDPEKMYIFRVEAPGYFSQEYFFSTPSGMEYAEITENLTIEPIPLDSVLFSGEPFASDSDALEGASLDDVITFLSDNPTVEVTIAVGLVEDKVDPISRSRVTALKRLFEENGLSLTRITWFRDLARPFNSFAVTITGFHQEDE